MNKNFNYFIESRPYDRMIGVSTAAKMFYIKQIQKAKRPFNYYIKGLEKDFKRIYEKSTHPKRRSRKKLSKISMYSAKFILGANHFDEILQEYLKSIIKNE